MPLTHISVDYDLSEIRYKSTRLGSKATVWNWQADVIALMENLNAFWSRAGTSRDNFKINMETNLNKKRWANDQNEKVITDLHIPMYYHFKHD